MPLVPSSINGMIQTRALPLNMLRRSVIRVYDSTTLLRGMKSTSSRKFLYQITVQQVFLLFNGIKFGMPITAPLKSGFSIQTRNQLEKLSVKTNTQPQDYLLQICRLKQINQRHQIQESTFLLHLPMTWMVSKATIIRMAMMEKMHLPFLNGLLPLMDPV